MLQPQEPREGHVAGGLVWFGTTTFRHCSEVHLPHMSEQQLPFPMQKKETGYIQAILLRFWGKEGPQEFRL